MATIHKLTKDGSTIFPATIADAVVHQDTGKTLTSMIKDYNVSELFPSEGIDGGNKYNLALAISVLGTHLTAAEKTGGISVTFISSTTGYPEEEYFLNKNTWSTNVADWGQRFEVGDVIADPSGSWTPSTAEAYVDQKVGVLNANLTQEVIARQTGDSNLQTQLNSEAALRSALSAEVDTLEENVAYIGANDGSSLVADFDPQTDTVWKKPQVLSSAEKTQVQTNINVYGKNQTYTKQEVNGLVDTPHQNYETVATYADLPFSGQAQDTIYRVSNYNGSTSQVDASVYSEYAWDGTQYVFLCVKSQIGEVFDISVYNNNATYTDLAAALGNDGENVPESLRKGGMSVKYVQTSDNKYVQFRCKTQSFSAESKDWAEIVEGLHTENNTYIAAFTVGGQILIAFKKDGDPVFGFGVPSQIVEYVTEQINILKDGSDTTDIDGVNKIFEFLADFSTSDTLKNLLDTKVSKELGKSLIQSDVAENMKFIANDEFLLALTDENKAIFEAIRKNGNKYIPTAIETDSFIGKTELSNNTIGFREIDSERKLISYRDSKGVKHENAGIDVGQCLINGVDVLEYIPKLQSPRFIHISDTHLDDMTSVENGVNGQERMALLVGMIKDEEKKGSFDAIICTGDCAMGFTYADGTRDNRLTKFKEWIIDEVSTPVYPVVGNHDGYTDEEWFSAFNLPKQYSVDLGTFYLIVLDVYRGSSEWSAGHTGDPDADEYGYIPQDIMISRGLSGDRELRFTSVDNTWLEQQLITAKNLCKPAIVAMHTWDTGGSLDISTANASVEKCQQLFSEYGCKVRLFGHSHIISNFRGTYAECNPGWFGLQNAYNYPTSPWAINVFEQKDGYFNVSSIILAHNYVDTPRLGNVSASVTTLPLWKDNVGRATFNIIND